jgi:hypothetical protein
MRLKWDKSHVIHLIREMGFSPKAWEVARGVVDIKTKNGLIFTIQTVLQKVHGHKFIFASKT